MIIRRLKRILKPIIFFIWLFPQNLLSQSPLNDLHNYLPLPSELHGLHLVDSALNYVGEDLFLLIDGGAEIYMEYGFIQVIAAKYRDQHNRTFHLEIYEMVDDGAAFGIYSSSSAPDTNGLSIGSGAAFLGYYLLFFKGNLYVSVSGPDAEKETASQIISIGKAVDNKILKQSRYPYLVDQVRNLKDIPVDRIIYLKGNIALSNIYNFHYSDIFDFSEAVICFSMNSTIYLMKYTGHDRCTIKYSQALEKLKGNRKFNSFALLNNGISFNDNSNHFFQMDHINEFIIVIQDDSEYTTVSSFMDILKINFSE